MCGGAIQTPALLQRSGLGRRLGGATLAAHPTVKLAARFDDEVNVPDDVPVHQVSEFARTCRSAARRRVRRWSLSLSDHWALFGDAVEAWRNISLYYAAIISEGRGRAVAVPGWRDPIVTYRLTRRDRDLLGAASPASPSCSSKPVPPRSTRPSVAPDRAHGATSRR